jgi:sarcosine oxidase subunit gamma
MVEAFLRRSPLAHRGLAARAAADSEASAEAGVRLGESPHRCQINLRGNPDDSAFAHGVGSVTHCALPAANRSASGAGGTLLWLGPDEWLLTAAPGREKELVQALRQALQGQHAAVVDVSEARTVITIAGRRARELLQKGTPLDLHPRTFEPGHCAQTGLTRANVILHQIDASPRYELYVLNSFADYLWTWLERAAAEYGLAVMDPVEAGGS